MCEIEKGMLVRAGDDCGKVLAKTAKFSGRVKVATGFSESTWYSVDSVEIIDNPDAPVFECNCNGSGKFYSGGMILNGVYTGKIGPCFRCGGKGMQSANDRLRNRVYDAKYRRISA